MKDKIEISMEKKKEMIVSIQEYFFRERQEKIGDLAASILLDFFIENLAPEFYNQGVYDSYKYFSDRVNDVFILQK